MANAVPTQRFAPKPTGVRDPRDTGKKNGMFHNPPRALYFGGVAQPFTQAGSRLPVMRPESTAVGPISDRGKGRG